MIFHGIVKDKNVNTIVPKGMGVFESGEWDLSEATAKALIGNGIMLHAGQKKPSRHGGVVTSYTSRVATKPNGDTVRLYTLMYVSDPKYIGVVYKGGWSQQVAIEG